MNPLHLALAALFAGVVIWFLLDAVQTYLAAPKKGFLAAFEDSATMLWASILAVCSSLIGASAQLATLLNDPSLAAAINAYIRPEYIPAVMLVIAIITRLARRRSLKKPE